MNTMENNLLALHLCGAFLQEPLVSYFNDADREKLLYRYGVRRYGAQFQEYLNQAPEILEFHKKLRIQSVSAVSPLYPENLKHIASAPLFLFAKGNLALLKKHSMISMIGTRKPSPLGILLASTAARWLAEKKFTIVSGMAMGIDAVCHRGALDTDSGFTIGVVAHGLNHVYPKVNIDLFQEAKHEGSLLLLSEYTANTGPRRHHFLRRNRIISGLSGVTIFVEGGLKSGGQITVRYALEQGREVFCFSHPDMKNNEGGNKLNEDGAMNLCGFFQPRLRHSSQGSLSPFQGRRAVYLGEKKWGAVQSPEGEAEVSLFNTLSNISRNCLSARPLFKVNLA